MTSIAAGTTRPSLDDVLATMSPEARGMWQASELNATHRLCTVSWCDHHCFWVADFVGGNVTRLHGRDLPQWESVERTPVFLPEKRRNPTTLVPTCTSLGSSTTTG